MIINQHSTIKKRTGGTSGGNDKELRFGGFGRPSFSACVAATCSGFIKSTLQGRTSLRSLRISKRCSMLKEPTCRIFWCPESTPNMTGRGFHCTTEVIPRRPSKSKSPFASRPIKISKNTRRPPDYSSNVCPPKTFAI